MQGYGEMEDKLSVGFAEINVGSPPEFHTFCSVLDTLLYVARVNMTRHPQK